MKRLRARRPRGPGRSADLLFVGTELGLWISLDGGTHWAQFKGGDFPNVAVRDLVVHPRDDDLVIATHGRGIWIVDDITPLRALTAEMLARDAAFLPGQPAVPAPPRDSAAGPRATPMFVGAESARAPRRSPTTRGRATSSATSRSRCSARTASSSTTLPTSKRRGLNRVAWSMRVKPPRVPPAATLAYGANIGPRVLPGHLHRQA